MIWGEVAANTLPPDVPTFIIGGGSSLEGVDFNDFAYVGNTIAVNEAAFHVAHMAACVSLDQIFMTKRAVALAELSSRTRLYLCPPEPMAKEIGELIPRATMLRPDGRGFSWDATRIHRQGGSSGYAALNAAVLMGAKRIVLMGFDGGREPGGGRKNWHEAYNWPQSENWNAWNRSYDAIAPELTRRGIEVVNANPNSMIKAFARTTLRESVAWEWKAAA